MDLKVFITTGESTCGECGEDLGRKAWITSIHACQKYSGCVGSSAAARALDEEAVRLAV